MGNQQRLQHIVESHGLQGLAQRQVNTHQHRAQLLVGQHHPHWQLVHRRVKVLSGNRLQHFGMAWIAVIGRASGVQSLFVQRRRHQSSDPSLQRLTRSPIHTAPGKFTRHCTDLPGCHRAQGRTDLQYRNTAWRQVQHLIGLCNLHHRPGQTLGRRHRPDSVAHGRHVARDKAVLQRRGPRQKGLGDDFGANARCIAQGDSDGQVACGAG